MKLVLCIFALLLLLGCSHTSIRQGYVHPDGTVAWQEVAEVDMIGYSRVTVP